MKRRDGQAARTGACAAVGSSSSHIAERPKGQPFSAVRGELREASAAYLILGKACYSRAVRDAKFWCARHAMLF
jgi:hypothetical protein